ncbi:MAG: O-methyltransferase [Melioribacteraceae bacterium]|nr:O-methyltransferase [Melioribacteraceae bacterium]MCF8356187.1 O-methyltransferase [Melioribacteraceae bacterium]MCF8394758.1 O-methyltransferase [Melioribacteraceae bacterium]MCF8417942.1 O-methyltransferase [Melioribacteraceae bacterium]
MDKILYQIQKDYLERFRKPVDELITEMEEYAKANRIPILGWLSAEFLEHLVMIQQPKRVLEIGTAIGYSTIRIARHLKKKSRVDTIEKSADDIEIAKGFIEKSGVSKKIKLIEGDAMDIMPDLDKKYNFIFIDADKEDYKKLFYYSLMLLKKGGVIFIDNLLWHGFAAAKKVPDSYKASAKYINNFNNLFTSQVTLKTSILPIGDGIGLGVKIG